MVIARRRTRRSAGIVGALLLAVTAFGGCADPAENANPAAPKLTEIRVATLPLGSTLPVHAAKSKGIFERNGLRVRLTEGQDPGLFTAGLAKGQYDIAMSVPTIVLVAAERGLDIQIVSRMQKSSPENPGGGWFTKDRSIDSLAKLKGKKIGVPALTGVITDSLVYLLQKSGVDRDEVKFVQMPFAAMGDQLKAGRVDAVVAGIPFSNKLAASGFRRHGDVVAAAVTEASDGRIDNGMTALFASSSKFARENPDTIRAWRKSLNEAIDYLGSHEADARQMLQSWLKMPPKVAQSAPLPGWQVEITPQDLEPYVTISKAVGTIKSEPDVNKLVWQDGP